MADNTRKPGFSKDTVSGQPIGQQALFQLDENGNYVPAGSSSPLFTYNFELAVSRGLVANHEMFEKFGRNPDIDTGSVPEDIWNGGDLYTGFPTGSAEQIEVISSVPASDNITGVGAQKVTLEGQLLGIPQTEELNVGDTSIVDWDRMPRMFVSQVGSSEFNVGTLTARHVTTTANIFAVMPIGTNRTQIGAFTVPAAKTLYLKTWDPRAALSSGIAASGVMAIMKRELNGTFQQEHTTDVNSSGQNDVNLDYFVQYLARTDVVARATLMSAVNMSATAQFFGVMVDD